MKNNCFVYRYTWEDGHVYVGKSKHGRKRYGVLSSYKLCPLLYNYWNKYGEPNKEILEDNIPESQINEKEQFYIQQNNSFHLSNEKGLNLTIGGDGGNIIGLFSQEKQNEVNIKRKETFYKNNNIEEYSKRKKEYYLNHPELKNQISKSLKEYYKNNPGKKEEATCRLKEHQISGQAWHNKMDKHIKRGENAWNNRPCICIETQEIFYSCVAAAEKYGGSYKVIHKSCKGECKTAAGYHWAYCDDEDKINELLEFKGQQRNIFKKQVVCIETDEILGNPEQVAKKFNVCSETIRTKCKNGKPIQGYHLKFVE